jgi:hypothetical protein
MLVALEPETSRPVGAPGTVSVNAITVEDSTDWPLEFQAWTAKQ